MRILWLATKAPWPPIDGGRRLVLDTFRGLVERGHEITLLAPVDPQAFDLNEIEKQLSDLCRCEFLPTRPRSWFASGLKALGRRLPLTVTRRPNRALAQRLTPSFLDPFDLVHLEQVQAFGPLLDVSIAKPVVLRTQNVESDLWRATAQRRGLTRRVFEREAELLALFEGQAVRRVDRALALTREDAARLSDLAGGREVEVVRAPFPRELPAGEGLDGEPAIVLFGSRGWWPNVAGARWFLSEAWPRIREGSPGAMLHVFGLDLDDAPVGVRVHPSPESSLDALAEGSVLVVPLQIASGVRIKILEAWARGVPVVATPTAARGLDATDGKELRLAEDGEAFARAIQELTAKPDLPSQRIEAGRAKLLAEHDPARIAERLEAIYATLLD